MIGHLIVGQIVNLFAMCAGRTGGRMKVARGPMWGSLASCGGLAIRPPGVGAQPNFHKRPSRVRRIGNLPAACPGESLRHPQQRGRRIANPPQIANLPHKP
jgi:hypothetical protein